MDQDKRSTQAIDPALLDRARKICDCFGLVDEPDYDTDCLIGDGFNEPCAIHYRIARALEEERKRGMRNAAALICHCGMDCSCVADEIRAFVEKF